MRVISTEVFFRGLARRLIIYLSPKLEYNNLFSFLQKKEITSETIQTYCGTLFQPLGTSNKIIMDSRRKKEVATNLQY